MTKFLLIILFDTVVYCFDDHSHKTTAKTLNVLYSDIYFHSVLSVILWFSEECLVLALCSESLAMFFGQKQ